MKKPKLSILVTITIAFAAFTLGLLLGRNSRHGDVTLQIPTAMMTEPTLMETHPLPTEEEISFPIDLNTAGKEELMALPGIGAVLAERIISYREAYGDFEAVEELMNVKDIGEKRLEDILDYITIGG